MTAIQAQVRRCKKDIELLTWLDIVKNTVINHRHICKAVHPSSILDSASSSHLAQCLVMVSIVPNWSILHKSTDLMEVGLIDAGKLWLTVSDYQLFKECFSNFVGKTDISCRDNRVLDIRLL
jgi:hypothetical protein